MKEFGIGVTFLEIGDSRALSFPGLLDYCPAKNALLELAPETVF